MGAGLEVLDLLLCLAVLTQAGLALVILWVLGRRRVPLVRRREVRMADIALDGAAWPVAARQASNAFDNQFQLPVVFYVASGLTLLLGTGWVGLILAWAFVVTRLVHAYIHLTSNYVPHRFLVFIVGFALLALFWLSVVIRIVMSLIAG